MNIFEIKHNAPNGATHYKSGRYYSFYTGRKSIHAIYSTLKNQSYVWTDSGWKSLAGFDSFDNSFIELHKPHSFNVSFERPSPNN